MKICLLGLDNLPVLTPAYGANIVAGEPVQQSLLASALARRGHQVSMVVADYGQDDGAQFQGVTTYKAYRRDGGLPVLRYIHPRWTGVWAALRRADADVYYTSCAGMHVGLLAYFCRRHGKRFVFRVASDSDCDPSALLVEYARDRWLYEIGLRRADAVLVQSVSQALAIKRSYGVEGRVAGMLVDAPHSAPRRDIDVLWISNIRQLKRPDRILRIAKSLPGVNFHIVGGPLGGEEHLYREIRRAAGTCRNVHFHGQMAYAAANAMYSRAKLLVNTSDIEGFPNSFLQAWIRGVPVVTLLDPDGVISREGLGLQAALTVQMPAAITHFLESPANWKLASERCLAYMEREYGEDKVLARYLETFDEVLRTAGKTGTPIGMPADAIHR